MGRGRSPVIICQCEISYNNEDMETLTCFIWSITLGRRKMLDDVQEADKTEDQRLDHCEAE